MCLTVLVVEEFLTRVHVVGLAERLFTMFDRKGNDAVDYEDFICGLAICCRGSIDERMRFVFEVYDLTGCVSLLPSSLPLRLHRACLVACAEMGIFLGRSCGLS